MEKSHVKHDIKLRNSEVPNEFMIRWNINNAGGCNRNLECFYYNTKYSLQGTTQGNGLTGSILPVRFSM